jgi:hypothetical protein
VRACVRLRARLRLRERAVCVRVRVMNARAACAASVRVLGVCARLYCATSGQGRELGSGQHTAWAYTVC